MLMQKECKLSKIALGIIDTEEREYVHIHIHIYIATYIHALLLCVYDITCQCIYIYRDHMEEFEVSLNKFCDAIVHTQAPLHSIVIKRNGYTQPHISVISAICEFILRDNTPIREFKIKPAT